MAPHTTLDRYVKMLRFDGYYMEEDAGYSVGKKTFRPVKVVYYLEDDTIAIHEPVTPVRSCFVCLLLFYLFCYYCSVQTLAASALGY